MKEKSAAKVLITLSEDMLGQISELTTESGISRSEFVRNAVALYIKQQNLRKMKEGYEAMAAINLQIAEESLTADEQQISEYETLLERL